MLKYANYIIVRIRFIFHTSNSSQAEQQKEIEKKKSFENLKQKMATKTHMNKWHEWKEAYLRERKKARNIYILMHISDN